MHDEIAALVARHGAPAALVDELVALVDRHPNQKIPLLRAVRDTFESIDLQQTLIDDEPTIAPDLEFLRIAAERYLDLGLIAQGGMGEVRRVRDVELNRAMAMKIIHPRLTSKPSALARFVEEAQATAQLQHPHIVPVYDAGILPDGRAWFTMREVRGLTMGAVIHSLHAGETQWTFRRLLGAFLSVCNAVAYAHERGVIHRDLKPDNVVLGHHGEVYVVDWGLAKVLGRRDWVAESGALPTVDRSVPLDEADPSVVVTDRASSGSLATRAGTITGTPVYMSPEQARGDIERIDERSDVYGLGALLYEILTGRPPFSATADVVAVVAMVAVGMREPMRPGQLQIPDALAAVVDRSMELDPAARYPSAAELARAVEDWLDGARRREEALEIVARALSGVDRAAGLREQATVLRADGERALAGLEPWRPESDKAPAWERLDQARTLERQADLAELGVDQGLQSALRVDPSLPEAHAALTERSLRRHTEAERARDEDQAARLETLIRLHAEALPAHDPRKEAATRYLKGDGTLTLHTEPAGAEVTLFRYTERHRRLVEVEVGGLGKTPIDGRTLPMGSYLARIRHPERPEVRLPVQIPRLGHHSSTPPWSREPHAIHLPTVLPPQTVYVPAGWFGAGGDPEAVHSRPAHRVWVAPFAIHRTGVTNAQYLEFLDDLVAQGRSEEALAHAPRERGSADGELGPAIYGFDGTHFRLEPDADGDVWQPDWPVIMVDWHGARAYLAWLSAQTGLPWRLPTELEWEKAARGVDGRWFPWGAHHDPSWCCMVDSHRDRRLPTPAGSWPIDVSPYGMADVAGNVGDWCLDAFDAPPSVIADRAVVPEVDARRDSHELIAARGGSWLLAARHTRAANRLRYERWTRNPGLGFRGVIAL